MPRSMDHSPSPAGSRRKRRSPSRSISRSPNGRKASPPPRRRSRTRSRSGSMRRDRRESSSDAPKPCKILGVFGLNYSTTRRDLEHHFSRFGDIDKVDLITDNQGGSRGFGFIAYYSVDDAKKARSAMTDKEFQGRRIRVDYSISKGPHQRTPGNYMGRGRSGNERGDRGDSRRSRSPSPQRRRRSPSPPPRRRGASRSPSPQRRRRYSRSPSQGRRRD